MTEGMHGLKVLALALLTALALMVVAASGASAAEFLVEEAGGKKTFAELGVMTETVSGSMGETELLAGEVKVRCGNGTVTGTLIKGGAVKLQILFGGCEVLKMSKCIVYETEDDDNKKEFPGYYKIEGTGKILLHEMAHYIELEGAPLGTIYFGDGEEECPLALSMAIAGSFALKTPTVLTMLVTQGLETITAGEITTLRNLNAAFGLTLAGVAAHFKAGSTGSFFLAGAKANKKWGAH
jgi:hypothetical protein